MDRQRRILISVLSGVRPKPLHILFYVRYQNRYYGNHISKREYFQITFWKIWVYFQAFKNSKEVGNMRKIWNWKFRLRGKKISSDTKIGPWFQSYTSSEIDRPDTYSWRSKFQAYLYIVTSLIQGVLELCEFHYCDFSKLSRNFLLMRWLSYFISLLRFLGYFGFKNCINEKNIPKNE